MWYCNGQMSRLNEDVTTAKLSIPFVGRGAVTCYDVYVKSISKISYFGSSCPLKESTADLFIIHRHPPLHLGILEQHHHTEDQRQDTCCCSHASPDIGQELDHPTKGLSKRKPLRRPSSEDAIFDWGIDRSAIVGPSIATTVPRQVLNSISFIEWNLSDFFFLKSMI